MFRSPVQDIEEKLGANFGEFAGWEMPMEYSSYQEEHMKVRQDVAFFDLSHMGRLRINGKIEEIERLVAKSLSKKEPGYMIGPTAFLNDKGGFIDDVMTYKVSENEFLIVTNALNREKVIKWIKNNSSLDVEDLTLNYVMLAIQGRRIWERLEKVDLNNLQFRLNTHFLGEDVFLLSRSGWTGEDGIEVWAKPDSAKKIIEKLYNKGVFPAGLIARDSLRQEMGFVLYGEDINEDINPIEARYWVFSLDKDFIGKEMIINYLKHGVDKFRIGFKLSKGERALPRSGQRIKILDVDIGYVTSSTYSPYLSRSIGMGYIKSKNFVLGYSADVEIRNKKYSIKFSDFPLVKL
ncbi:glycine cleavage system aminomethyltransferase GcvT [Acidianus brierleyi]|uniref:aminomethyltransferase n=1 Tax=Acidianus brierleyi TaxID=41673 RepID=A0A2U9IIX8_9CREN|nr:glycine cleavage system aminomethyltransferase GcvT [Acidianus brierleyi]AWR95989.1 glycine cleavage system aminomethyltransferase GcvT [Acidianus brierleyi]